jgi:hypothetical protein
MAKIALGIVDFSRDINITYTHRNYFLLAANLMQQYRIYSGNTIWEYEPILDPLTFGAVT